MAQESLHLSCGVSSFLQVPFLNLMSSLAQRGGRVNVRVGGNTQEYATLVSSNSNGKMIQKQNTGNNNPVGLIHIPVPVQTLTLLYNEDTNTDTGLYGGGFLSARKRFISYQRSLVPW